jgi:hypothetical protein
MREENVGNERGKGIQCINEIGNECSSMAKKGRKNTDEKRNEERMRGGE